MISRGSIIWLVVSVLAAMVAGYFAFCSAEKFTEVVDLLATVISILIGVSLAVVAVLSAPFSVAVGSAKDEDEAARITNLVNRDDDVLSDGQLLLFRLYFIALFFALTFKWVTAGDTVDFDLLGIRILSSLTATTGVLAFFWSARLPLMLRELAKQRRTLG